ncbi:MAG: NFACT family protein [Lachnospiraceae bacterium]|nr:NFACT family protein [Lachnospiraceae bacterium]
MAFDGSTIHGLVHELNQTLLNRKISKIAQPEKEELMITVKGEKGTYRLLISANASLPLIYLSSENKPSPITAPNFCMVLRKYIGNGKITEISQIAMERVIRFRIEHLDELGDWAEKFLYVEIMGKHSNIIFCDSENRIIDAIKHVGYQMSSVREVLPGREYFIPMQEGKHDPFTVTKEAFFEEVCKKAFSVPKALSDSFMGFGFALAEEISYRSHLEHDDSMLALSIEEKERLYGIFCSFMQDLQEGHFAPEMVYEASGERPKEFAVFELQHFADLRKESYDSVSALLEDYYARRNKTNNMHQKSQDLRKIVATLLDRNQKKYQLQSKQMQDTEKMEKYRVYGELLHTYGYSAVPGAKEITVDNYYTNEPLAIPLDPQKDAMENAAAYFERYNKLKRTKENLTDLLVETKSAIEHLSSIATSLTIAESEGDLAMIRQELSDYGYIKKHHSRDKKKGSAKGVPLHYVTSDGYHIYVGKNNYQNDELTFKFATGNDWWFHAKKMPGSHVIVKADNKELPDHIFEIAAALAGYYSSGRDSDKLEIDYLQKKNVKKPAGAVPGYVIYYTNYSMSVKPELRDVTPVK